MLMVFPTAPTGSRRFGNAVPLMRSKVLQDYLPAPLHSYVAAAFKRLPDQLCKLPPKTVGDLPNAFKDEVHKLIK